MGGFIFSGNKITAGREILCLHKERLIIKFSFYKKIFKYRPFFASKIVEQLEIKSIEEIFYTQFEAHGFKKRGISIQMTSDGYDETYVVFENNEGMKLKFSIQNMIILKIPQLFGLIQIFQLIGLIS